MANDDAINGKIEKLVEVRKILDDIRIEVRKQRRATDDLDLREDFAEYAFSCRARIMRIDEQILGLRANLAANQAALAELVTITKHTKKVAAEMKESENKLKAITAAFDATTKLLTGIAKLAV